MLAAIGTLAERTTSFWMLQAQNIFHEPICCDMIKMNNWLNVCIVKKCLELTSNMHGKLMAAFMLSKLTFKHGSNLSPSKSHQTIEIFVPWTDAPLHKD